MGPDPTLTALVVSWQTARCLRFIRQHPGCSGVEVRRGLGMRHDSQVSRLLARLERDGLAAGEGSRAPRAWRVTARGEAVLEALPEGFYARSTA